MVPCNCNYYIDIALIRSLSKALEGKKVTGGEIFDFLSMSHHLMLKELIRRSLEAYPRSDGVRARDIGELREKLNLPDSDTISNRQIKRAIGSLHKEGVIHASKFNIEEPSGISDRPARVHHILLLVG